MESIHSPKKPGAARAGVLAAFLLLALLLALPCAWYAVYHDQMTAPSAAGSVPFGVAPLARPSGIIPLPPPASGTARTVQIRHVGGQIITTVNDGDMRITAHLTDPRRRRTRWTLSVKACATGTTLGGVRAATHSNLPTQSADYCRAVFRLCDL